MKKIDRDKGKEKCKRIFWKKKRTIYIPTFVFEKMAGIKGVYCFTYLSQSKLGGSLGKWLSSRNNKLQSGCNWSGPYRHFDNMTSSRYPFSQSDNSCNVITTSRYSNAAFAETNNTTNHPNFLISTHFSCLLSRSIVCDAAFNYMCGYL